MISSDPFTSFDFFYLIPQAQALHGKRLMFLRNGNDKETKPKSQIPHWRHISNTSRRSSTTFSNAPLIVLLLTALKKGVCLERYMNEELLQTLKSVNKYTKMVNETPNKPIYKSTHTNRVISCIIAMIVSIWITLQLTTPQQNSTRVWKSNAQIFFHFFTF